MTVVVAFYCKDGVVIGADSMLTPSVGNLQVGHHKGVKVEIISNNQAFAFAGDQGQAARIRILANSLGPSIDQRTHPIDHPLIVTISAVEQFAKSGISDSIGVGAVLAYPFKGGHQVCVFEGKIQPRLLDNNHFYVALGTGKLSADPFLRFLVDIFCTSGPPTKNEAALLTVWAIQHVIDTNPGGVAGPIRMACLEQDNGAWMARVFSDDEIDDHRQAVESATNALRSWRDGFTGDPFEGASPPPTLDP